MTKLIFIVVGLISFHGIFQSNEVKSIEYIAVSRGVMNQVIISKDTISVKTLDFEKKESNAKDNWENLLKEASRINLETIDNLKTISDDRYTDKALSAQLIIQTFNSTYTSIEFDHGNPPKEIKNIVETLTSYIELE